MQSNPAPSHTETTLDGKSLPPEVQQEILRAIAGIDYGSVEVVIHNAKVIQIEVRNKRRFGGENKPLR
jgi:hypothetical protein